MNTSTQVNTPAKVKAEKPVTQKAEIEGGLAWFQPYLSQWQVAQWGSKPTEAMCRASLALGAPGKGKRPGIEALHIAMCLRPEGCTVRQFMGAGSGGPANNWRRALRRDYGLVTEAKVGTPYAFILRLTPKGVEQLKAAGVAIGGLPVEKPAKVPTVTAGKPKPVQATVPAKPATPASEGPKPMAHPVLTNDGPKPVNEPANAK